MRWHWGGHFSLSVTNPWVFSSSCTDEETVKHLRWNSKLMHMCSAAQFCLALCDPMDCSPPGSPLHGILQARILEWVAISSSRGSSRPRDWTCVSCISGIDGRVLYHGATWQAWNSKLRAFSFLKLPNCCRAPVPGTVPGWPPSRHRGISTEWVNSKDSIWDLVHTNSHTDGVPLNACGLNRE